MLPDGGHDTGAALRSPHGTRVLVVAEFLAPDMCRRVREAMDAGASEPAEILGDRISLDEQVRRAWQIEIDGQVRDVVEARLEAARPSIEAFFNTPLGAREGLSVLRYGAGGFYRRHSDQGWVRGWPPATRRCISTVVFLTSSRADAADGTFTGGALRLFASDDAGSCEVPGRAGTLVAFHATTPHEVTPVTEGVRDTAVDWFECRMPTRRCSTGRMANDD